MSLTDYVIMPGADYKDACDAVREKTGGTEPIKSGQMGDLIRGLSDETLLNALCTKSFFDLSGKGPEVIAKEAFPGGVGWYIENVSLSEVKEVKGSGFFNCSNIKSISLPSVTIAGNSAFCACKALETVEMPNLITISDRAFAVCEQLKTAVFPKVESVCWNAFCDCTALENIGLPSAKVIGEIAFENCGKLQNIILPSVASVEQGAFIRCAALKKVDFGAVVNFGVGVFYQCDALEAVIFRTTEGVCLATPETLMDSPLMTGTAHVYIHESMWGAYTAVYGDYMVLFRKIEDYPEICG